MIRNILPLFLLAGALLSASFPYAFHHKDTEGTQSTQNFRKIASERPPSFATKKNVPHKDAAGNYTGHATAPLRTPDFGLRTSDFGLKSESDWVDSVFNALTDAERIGQLLVLRAHSDKDSAYEQMVEDQIRKYHVGGLCFFQGTPTKQAVLTNRYQAAARLPLVISMDAEWGLGMRLRGTTISYPKQLMLGALRDDTLVYAFGRELARQCRRLGVHLNFAPVADVNNNPGNPVINDRSFGEDRRNVAAKSLMYMRGLQDGGVMACAKHFPGHGDTDVDSHFELPVINHPRKRLDSLELYPFRSLIEQGVGSIMVAHLNIPTLDNRPNRPSTLSAPIVTDLLRRDLAFDGLIMTDAMEMQGVAKYYAPGQADVEALRAGNDMVLLPLDPGAASEAILQALADSTLDRAQVYASVKRVLRAKYRLGLTTPQRVETQGLVEYLNRPEAQVLKRRLIAGALTLVRDRPGLVGFRDLEKFHFATLALGDTNRTVFQTYCGYYAPMTHFNAPARLDSLQTQALLDTMRRHDVVLVSLHNMRSRAADNFGLDSTQINFLRRLHGVTTVVLTVFGNPYSLKYFDDAPVLLEAYNEDPYTQELAAQALFGAVDLAGALPVTVSPAARYGAGLRLRWDNPRLGYSLPEAVGMRTDTLRLIDTLVRELIAAGAAPGCQVLVAKDNQIVWHKAYGRFAYADTAPAVQLDHLYDLASVTKVAATTLALMRLTDENCFDPDMPMSSFIPELLHTNKLDLGAGEILAHQAGLQAWIPFYKETMTADTLPSPNLYKSQAGPGFNIPVAEGLFMSDAWVDSVWQKIYRSELRPDKSYKYSDLGLYLGLRAAEYGAGGPLESFVQYAFYRPLGLATTTYNPWRQGWTARCAPTEEDRYFRRRRIQGYVHDMGAAMLGGVSGHAGLFSNANDLAKLFQMLLNKGRYGGRSFLTPEVVRRYTTRFPGSTRRGLGFDMKELNPNLTANMSPLAGPNTFGHTGFTGNSVWADPDQNLLVIFLSNRTYPSMENNKLIQGDYRPKVQGIVYRAMAPKP